MSAAPPEYIVKNILLFGRLLRLMGLDVGVSDMVELADALTRISLARKADVYHAARSVLVRRHEDYPLFDQAWQAFWRKPSNAASWMRPSSRTTRTAWGRLPRASSRAAATQLGRMANR